MKKFFKSVLAVIAGVLISCLIIGGIAVLIIVGFTGIFSDSYSLKDNTVLTIKLSGVMKDKVTPNPIYDYLDIGGSPEISLTDILSAIKKAKDNDKIKGIYIRSGYFTAPSASLVEIRNALIDFKSTGKFIISYADDYLQSGYFVASVSDKVIMNPQGTLDLHGLAVSPTFYKGLLDKIGVEMQIFKVGTYKSAVEPYMLDKMSDANREQVTAFANDIWSTVLKGISSSRNISVEKLNQLTDTLPAFRASSFVIENNLADTLMYETDVKEYLKTLLHVESSKDVHVATIDNMQSVDDPKESESKDQIAILYAEGSIVSGNSSSDINDKYLIRQIEKLKKDEDVKAVVFRVNSPGGSAYASEQIWRAITELKASKPVVVSMGGYAASGGYYISSNATKIFAQPTTLTGSIGIFGMFPNMEGLTNKIGLTFDKVKTNKFSDFGNVTRPMSSEEKEILQQYINRGYDLFLTRCSEGRNIPKDQLEKIAEGRVWTGQQALKIGLVDAIGGIDDAVKEAAKLSNTQEYSTHEYPHKPGMLGTLLKSGKDQFATRALKEYLDNDFQLLKTIKEINNLKEQDFIQARMPYDLDIQ